MIVGTVFKGNIFMKQCPCCKRKWRVAYKSCYSCKWNPKQILISNSRDRFKHFNQHDTNIYIGSI